MLRALMARPVFEELEQRLLYSADFAPAALAGFGAADFGEQRLLQAQPTAVAAQAGAELAFVDMSLPDAESLIADLQAQHEAGRPIEIVRIASDEDGIARISATLAGRNDITAVHVLGHGSDGMVKLGNARLDASTVLSRAGELAGWSAGLRDDADLLLYGCDVATSASGQQLVASLAALTGADVAASDDPTGAVSRGGDWVLEVQTGTIDAQGALSAQVQAQWQGVLAATYYLDGDLSPPFSGLVTTPPSGLLLPNFDPGRDASPGLVIAKDNASPSQSDPTKHHTWVAPAGAVVIANERVTLTFWTDIKDGMNALQTADVARDKEGHVTAYLMDLASATATSGTVIASRSVTDDEWGDGFAWEEKTIDFGTVNYSVAAGRHLALKLVNNDDESEDDLWFAYDTPAFQSRLQIGTVNSAPSLALPGGPVGYSENAAATVLDAAASVTDADSPNFDGGTLRVDLTANGSAADRLAIRNQGIGAGQIGVSGANVSYGGTTIGSWSGGTDGATPLVVSFNSGATPAAVQALARNVTYENVSDDPSTAARTVRFVVSDGDGGTTSAASKTVNVSAVNDSPVITSNGGTASALVSVAENSTAITTVSATDADASAALTYSIAGGADAARFAIDAATGALSFVSAPDYETPTDAGGNNVYNVTVAVSDGALSDTQSVAVTITDVNDNAPVITSGGGGANASISAAENNIAVTTVTATDADAGATLIYSISGGADAAAFTINASTGVLAFIAAPDYEAPADAGGDNVYNVTVRASDGVLTDTQAIAVTVTDTNDNAPGITANSLIIAEGGTAAPVISAVDPDNTPAELSYTVSGLSGGRFELTTSPGVAVTVFTQDDVNAGRVRFVSDGGEAAPGYQLSLSDGALATAAQAGSVTYTNVNDAPVIGANSLTISEGDVAAPSINAMDPDNSPAQLAYTVSGLSGGRFELTTAPGVAITAFTQADVDVGLVRFVSDGGEAAPAYQLALSDGALGTGAQAASVSYTNVNDAPAVVAIDLGSMTEDMSHLVTQAQLLAGALDAEGDTLSAINLGLAAGNGSLTNNGNGTWTFTPAADWTGNASFSFNVTDGSATVANSASLIVSAVNDAPTVVAIDLGTIDEDTSRLITQADLLAGASDADGGALSATSLSLATGSGTLTDLGNGTWTFVPAANWNGTTSFSFNVTDGSATVANNASLLVSAVNDAPSIVAIDLGTIDEDTSRQITQADLLAASTDTDGDTLGAVNLQLTTGNGVLADNGNGTWTFSPAANWNGVVGFAFDVTDGSSSVRNGASLDVRAVNDAPLITSNGGAAQATLAIAENVSAITTVQGSDVDVVTTPRYEIAGGADAASFVIDSASGVLRFVAAPDHERPADADHDNRYEIIVSVSDGQLTARQALSIDVGNVDEAPAIVSNALQVSAGGATLILRAADSDTPASALGFTVSDVAGGHFERAGAPGQSVDVFTQADIDAGGVRFVRDGSGTTPSYTLTLSDGVSTVTSAAPDILFDAEPAAAGTPAAPGDPATAPPASAAAPTPGAETAATAAPALAPDVGALPPAAPRAAPLPDVSPPEFEPGSGAFRTAPAAVAAAAGSADARATVSNIAFVLPSEDGSPVEAATRAHDAVETALRERDLESQLDRVRDQVVAAASGEREVIASTLLLSSSLSVGYVLWLGRGGVLLASLLSALPAWSRLDPLPVLAQVRRRDDERNGDAPSDAEHDRVETLFAKARQWLAGKDTDGATRERT